MGNETKELVKKLAGVIEDELGLSYRDARDLLYLLFNEMKDYTDDVVTDVICNFTNNEY